MAERDRDEARSGDAAGAPARVDVPCILATAAACALAVGIAHVAQVLFVEIAQGSLAFVSRDIVWMAPAGELIVFACVAATLLAVVALVPAVRRHWLRLSVVSIASLAIFEALVLTARRIHPLASLVLAAGLGVRLGALAVRHPGAWRRWSLRAATALAVLTVVAGAGWRLRLHSIERRPSVTSPVAGARRPNLLVIILDTVRAASMSLYGHPRPTTPHLERWARRGTTFAWAMTPSSWSLTSHASMFTGVRPARLSTTFESPLDQASETLAETLAAAGWRTGGFNANVFYGGREAGLSQGFEHYEEYPVTPAQVLLSAVLPQLHVVRDLWWSHSGRAALRVVRHLDLRYPAEPRSVRWNGAQISANFLRWQARRDGRPFFAFLNYFDAHLNYTPGSPIPPEQRRYNAGATTLDRYESAIAYLDEQVDGVLRELERRGELERTLVIITSDHGELFGEHRLYGHGNGLYAQLLHVPLIVLAPDRADSGVVVSEAVSMRHLRTTALAILGLPADAAEGRSWFDRRAWTAAPVYGAVRQMPDIRRDHPEWPSRMVSVVHGPWHYLTERNGTERLYAYRTDLDEEHDLVPDATLRSSLDSLRCLAQLRWPDEAPGPPSACADAGMAESPSAPAAVAR